MFIDKSNADKILMDNMEWLQYMSDNQHRIRKSMFKQVQAAVELVIQANNECRLIIRKYGEINDHSNSIISN